MSQQFMLLESNPEIGLKNDIYQDITVPFRDPIISDELNAAVMEVFNSASDKSLFSQDIETRSNTQELKAVLSLGKFRFLQGFDLSRVSTVLDLSEDAGGVAHFIADQVGLVESVKIDPALAKLSAVRCANKHNVCHISADLDTLTFPSNYYDLIVIGQLEALTLNSLELASLFQNLCVALTENGVIVINTINSGRLNKWLDAQSNDANDTLKFADLYKASDFQKSKDPSKTVEEIDRKQLRDIVLNSNFASVDIHAGFSSALECQALFSENYLTANVNSVNHFYNLGSLNNSDINEYLLYQRLVNEKQDLVDYATRFVVLAGASSKAVHQVYNNDFSHFPNSNLKPQWQTVTSRSRSAQNVSKQAFYAKPNAAELAPFYKGRLLIDDWLQALLGLNRQRFELAVQEYNDYLNSAELNLDNESDGAAFDLSPSKIILHERAGQRRYHPIGQQQSLSSVADGRPNPDFLLFRTLYWLTQENKSLVANYAAKNDLYSVGMFILEHMPTVFQLDDLAAFAELEELYQSDISKQSMQGVIQLGLSESFYQQPELYQRPELSIKELNPVAKSVETLSHTVKAQNLSLVGQSHRLKLLRVDNEQQTQRIAALVEHRSDLLEHRAEQIEKLKKHQQSADDLENKLRSEIDHLHERLHAQNVRNDELHGYLLMRPTTRAKRVARRTLNRMTGQPAIEHQAALEAAEPIKEVEEVEELPLPTGELIGQNTEDYQQWILENTLSDADIQAAKADIEAMAIKPMFSILVPIYNTDPEYLLPMIESVQRQIYPHWQLCLVDDCSPKSYLKRILEHEALQDERISVQLNNVNQGISVTTNDALAMATGDYIALLDHDDEISIDALYENAKVINATPDVGLIYSDEDKMDMQGERLEAYFKPDYSPDLLHTNNYICHFTVIKKSIADELGGFREGLDGSQDHDIIIRSAAAAERIVHIPKILYHWRKIPGSTAVAYDSKSYAWEAGRKAVEDQLKKEETGVRVEFGSLKGTYRVFREIKGNPLISIVIPFKDKPELLDSCLNSILNRSSYANIEIIGVSNNSDQDLTHERMAYYSELDNRVRFIEKNIPFNFSTLCNYGVEHANGEYIILLNNDIEIISPDWIERLLEHAQRDEIGAVGGKLLYPDGCIQHAGVVAGMVGAAGHPHKFFPDNHIGYHGRLHMVYNVSAVTGAMMMVKTSKYRDVGGLDEDNLAVAYNDIDLCLKLLKEGYYNVFTPHSKATHHESISRGYEDTDEKLQRLLKEQRHFLTKWESFLETGDPYYNPNLSLKNERFSLNFKD